VALKIGLSLEREVGNGDPALNFGGDLT